MLAVGENLVWGAVIGAVSGAVVLIIERVTKAIADTIKAKAEARVYVARETRKAGARWRRRARNAQYHNDALIRWAQKAYEQIKTAGVEIDPPPARDKGASDG